MNGVQPPYELPSRIVYFHDWRYVDHGYLRWLGPDNQPIPLMPAPQPLPPVHASAEWLPRGVRLETMPGTADAEPVLTAREFGEPLFFGGSVIRDGGTYRLFYESVRPGFTDPSHEKVLRTAESDDGRTWRLPKLGHVADPGGAGNAVFDPGATGYHGGCVFRDAQAPAAERYKAMWLGQVNAATLARYRERWPDDVDPMAVTPPDSAAAREGRAAWALCGAVSPDGHRWRQLDDPLMIQHSDTFNCCTWDPLFRRYVAYPRTWYYGHRGVGRAESLDFRHFCCLRQVLWPDASMRATDTWYTPGVTTMPDAPDYRLMFATLWSQVDDTFRPVLHTSADGMLWQRTPGQPMLELGPPGSWCACGGAVTTLVELPGDRLGSLILGWHVPHKYPRTFPGFGQAGWLTWRRGRLVALRADEDACFSLYPLRFQGRRLILNLRAQRAGWVRVGVRAGDKWLRNLEDCDFLSGDALDQVVSWKGETDLGHADGEPVTLRFELRAADLFSIRFA
ncbi:MAG: hypothetical protein ACYS5V_15330 [Planctomycetota bacterium]|jgi:hypothetical protein